MESILEIEENLGNKCWHKIENQILQCISSQGTPLYHRVIRIGRALQDKINALQTQHLRIILILERGQCYKYTCSQTNKHSTCDEKSNKKPTLISGQLHPKKQRRSHSTLLPYIPAYGKRIRARQRTTHMLPSTKVINADALIETKSQRDAASNWF